MKHTLPAILLLALALTGCGRSVAGRYSLNTNPSKQIEFHKNGKLLVEASGDIADYTVEGDTIQVTHMVGGAIGHIDGDTITFTGNGIVAASLRGTWTRQK